jgi:hypothetical protein
MTTLGNVEIRARFSRPIQRSSQTWIRKKRGCVAYCKIERQGERLGWIGLGCSPLGSVVQAAKLSQIDARRSDVAALDINSVTPRFFFRSTLTPSTLPAQSVAVSASTLFLPSTPSLDLKKLNNVFLSPRSFSCCPCSFGPCERFRPYITLLPTISDS